jgi:hypothetical protein
VIDLFGNLQVLGDLGDIFALGERSVGLSELAYDLIWRVRRFFTATIVLPSRPGHSDSHSRWTYFRGAGQHVTFLNYWDFSRTTTLTEAR